ncbi:nucleotidyltransferase [Enterococcus sp. LJL120]
MKTCGVIVEYNPFHNGHRYHLQKARQESQAEVVIAVMSGNFLQRGEPAIVDKWQRANAALLNGADLVLELPVQWSVQSADYFAKGAVKILQEMNCQALCFGTDSQNHFDYQKFGEFVSQQQPLIDETFQSLADSDLNYPQKMTAVFRKIYPENQLDFATPNHILGLSYAKENAKYPQPMKLLPIQREQAGYHDQKAGSGDIASATAIRNLLKKNAAVDDFMPQEMAAAFKDSPLIDWEKLWPYLKYQILTSSLEDLAKIYQMNEGLEYLFKEAVVTAENFASFIEALKSKRYTWVRLQRLCLYVLGKVTEEEVIQAQANSQLRILGFTAGGQQFISENRHLPWLSRFSKESGAAWNLTVKMDRVYQLADAKIPEENFGRPPIRV